MNRNEINCTSWASRKRSVELADTSETLYAFATGVIQMIIFQEFAFVSAVFWFRFYETIGTAGYTTLHYDTIKYTTVHVSYNNQPALLFTHSPHYFL
jgi:hypothetical protein